MRRIECNLYPNGKKRCVTFSYDDGFIYDVRLTELLDKYGAKCTFNLNGKNINTDKYIDKGFIREISNRHEIACHAYSHPFLERLPVGMIVKEIYEEKRILEDIIEKPVIGMAYPYGTYDDDVLTALKAVDVKYSRTVRSTGSFGHPNNYLEWHPSCHHKNALPLADTFVQRLWRLPLFYVWGHSYEFNDDNNWELMDELLKKLSEVDDVWYATNGEVYDYINAVKNLRIAVDEKSVYNPSAVTVFATLDGKRVVELKPGLTRI